MVCSPNMKAENEVTEQQEKILICFLVSHSLLLLLHSHIHSFSLLCPSLSFSLHLIPNFSLTNFPFLSFLSHIIPYFLFTPSNRLCPIPAMKNISSVFRILQLEHLSNACTYWALRTYRRQT